MTPAPNQQWYCAEVISSLEAIIAFTMRYVGVEPFLPLQLHANRVSGRTKRKELTAKPELPGYLFFKATQDTLMDVRGIRGVQKVLSSPLGEAVAIPCHQMEVFMAEHDKWISDAIEAHRRGRQIKNGRKVKFRKMTPELLKEYLNGMGAE